MLEQFIQLRLMKNLINEQCEINDELEEYPDASLTVSILGTQSSGKSTLLNAIFNSRFPVLDTSHIRQRCTRGVWLQHVSDFNLVDTEGFDSMERSEQQKIFEKQMSLFCVVISDVIMINLFMQQVGRYSGGHIDILEAVFKVGERLVTPHQKKIIYIVRDCTEDADRQILTQQLSAEIKNLAGKYKNKQLKYTIEFVFMSHYVYQSSKFQQQAKKILPMLTIKRPSIINNYKKEDRVKYLQKLWQQIRDSKNDIDLKSIDDALKNYVMQRVRNECIQILQNDLINLNTLDEVQTYQRFNHILSRDIEDYLTQNKPTHMKKEQLKPYGAKIFEQFEPTASKHFNNVILKNIEDELEQIVTKEIEKHTKNKKLSHMIFKKKREVIDIYKKAITNHKEYSLLLKNFNEKMSVIINNEERKLNHLFSLFESRVEGELNNVINSQVNALVFKKEQINDKIKALCSQYQYNQWEVDFKDIWEKVSYRCIEKLIPPVIEQKSVKSVLNVSFLSGDESTSIIAVHTNIEKKALNFCRQILLFLNEDNTFTQPLSQVKEIVRECLQKRLIEEQRRWKISLLLISFLLLLLYGELETFMGWISIKKKKKRLYLRIYYWSVIVLLVFSLWKEWSRRIA